MKKTRKAAISVHAVLIGLMYGAGAGASAAPAGVKKMELTQATMTKSARMPSILLRITAPKRRWKSLSRTRAERNRSIRPHPPLTVAGLLKQEKRKNDEGG